MTYDERRLKMIDRDVAQCLLDGLNPEKDLEDFDGDGFGPSLTIEEIREAMSHMPQNREDLRRIAEDSLDPFSEDDLTRDLNRMDDLAALCKFMQMAPNSSTAGCQVVDYYGNEEDMEYEYAPLRIFDRPWTAKLEMRWNVFDFTPRLDEFMQSDDNFCRFLADEWLYSAIDEVKWQSECKNADPVFKEFLDKWGIENPERHHVPEDRFQDYAEDLLNLNRETCFLSDMDSEVEPNEIRFGVYIRRPDMDSDNVNLYIGINSETDYMDNFVVSVSLDELKDTDFIAEKFKEGLEFRGFIPKESVPSPK